MGEDLLKRDMGDMENFEELLSAAEMADAAAMNRVGICYVRGQGVAQDYAKAAEWFEKAAEAGNSVAMKNLGVCYDNGMGVAQDYAKAAEWYEKAAEAGNSVAMNELGMCYVKGHGVEQDYAKAAEWYEKATEAGNSVAMKNLGVCYDNGCGVEKDHAKAEELYRKAAEAGKGNAQKEGTVQPKESRDISEKKEVTFQKKYSKPYEYYEKACQRLKSAKSGDPSVNSEDVLDNVRKSLESGVKNICGELDIPLKGSDGNTVDLNSLINELLNRDIIGNSEANLLHTVRMAGNRSVHAEEKNTIPTLQEAEDILANMEEILHIFEEKFANGRSNGTSSPGGSPMVNPNYYDKSRRYYGKWDDRSPERKPYDNYFNGYSFDITNLRTDSDYLKLERAANQNHDVQAMLDIAVGFLPAKAGIVWGDDQMICMPKCVVKEQTYYQENAYDARYYYWISRAVTTACKLRESGQPYHKKYLATAVLEFLKFSLHYWNAPECNPYVSGINNSGYRQHIYRYTNQFEMVQKWYNLGNTFPCIDEGRAWNLLESLIDEAGTVEIIAGVHNIFSKADCKALVGKIKRVAKRRRIETEQAAERRRIAAEPAEERSHIVTEWAEEQNCIAIEEQLVQEEKKCKERKTRVRKILTPLMLCSILCLAIFISFSTRQVPISISQGIYCGDYEDGAMACIESDGTTGRITFYRPNGSSYSYEGEFYRRGFQNVFDYTEDKFYFGENKEDTIFGKYKLYRVDNSKIENRIYYCTCYPYDFVRAYSGTSHYQGMAKLDFEENSALFYYGSFSDEVWITPIEYDLQVFSTAKNTYLYCPDQICYKAQFADDAVTLICDGEEMLTLYKSGTENAKICEDDSFDGTLMSLPRLETKGLCIVSSKSPNTIELADGESADNGIRIGDSIASTYGYAVYDLDRCYSTLTFRDSNLPNGEKFKIGYNFIGDGRTLPIKSIGDDLFACDVSGVKELKVELEFLWGLWGHAMTDMRIS